jgi:hypothetical protein
MACRLATACAKRHSRRMTECEHGTQVAGSGDLVAMPVARSVAYRITCYGSDPSRARGGQPATSADGLKNLHCAPFEKDQRIFASDGAGAHLGPNVRRGRPSIRRASWRWTLSPVVSSALRPHLAPNGLAAATSADNLKNLHCALFEKDQRIFASDGAGAHSGP